MAAEPSVNRALRILEAIYLLLPIAAILLQSMVRFYAEDDSIGEWEKAKAFVIALAGYGLLVASAASVLVVLTTYNIDTFVFLAALGSFIGLVAFGVAVAYLVNHVMDSNSTLPKEERTQQSKLETEMDGGEDE